MKLDKIRFAKLVQYLDQCNFDGDIESLDQLVDIDIPEAPAASSYINPEQLHVLMALMQEGTSKIDAIKQHRMMTGYGLKDSKDIVEKYWPDQLPKLSKVELFAKLRAARAAGLQNDSEFHDIERFIENCFK